MENYKTFIVAALSALVVVVASSFFDTDKEHTQFGALAGPDIMSPYLSWGGVRIYQAQGSLKQGTTTSCSIQTPASTSTLQSFVALITGGHDVAVTANLTKGAAMQASTTALSSNHAVTAEGTLTLMASTTNAESTRVLAPNSWVQVNVFGGVGTASTTGTCQASFQEIY
jgi:hypothetical protein